MAMEVITLSPAADFNFDSASTSPFISAPTSPLSFSSFCRSADTVASFCYRSDAAPFTIPFDWEEKPGIPKYLPNSSAASSNYGDAEDDLGCSKEFAFDFSGQLDRDLLPADELFNGGRIKPLKPPPRFEYDRVPEATQSSPRSPGKFLRHAFSRENLSWDFDPFAEAMEQTRRDGIRRNSDEVKRIRSKESSRSLSPLRSSDLLFEPNPCHEPDKGPPTIPSSFWHRRWRIKDLLLLRSASEGQGKSAASGSSRRKISSAASAHKLDYTVADRRLSEEMTKRSFLSYKHGLFACLGFLPPAAAAQDQFPASRIISPTGSPPRGRR